MSDDHGSSTPETSISRSEFARRCGVTPGRVTQWVDEGKIHGDALDGGAERGSKIFDSLACSQLGLTLDIHQRLGNGSGTNLRLDTAPRGPGLQLVPPVGGNVLPLERTVRSAGSQAPPRPPAAVDEVGEAIRREQLEALQRKNRREAIDEEAQSGRFTDAADARQEMGRLAARLVTGFEGSLPELASAIAGHFKLPQRDVLHVLRGAYREARAKQAEGAKTAAAAMPEFVDAEVEIAREPEPA